MDIFFVLLEFAITVTTLVLFVIGVAALTFNLPLATACLIGAFVGHGLTKE